MGYYSNFYIGVAGSGSIYDVALKLARDKGAYKVSQPKWAVELGVTTAIIESKWYEWLDDLRVLSAETSTKIQVVRVGEDDEIEHVVIVNGQLIHQTTDCLNIDRKYFDG